MKSGNRKLSGAEIVWESLICEGVDVVFGYPGGTILPVYDALSKYTDQIKHVLVRHEQGAAHAADGYSRVSGEVGVAMATSGPGAANLITGIATAMMDSVPMVCITGQVPTSALGTDAFQESDITGATLPLTKHSYLVNDVDELAETIREAFYIARTGRPGPVLVDIPKDVQIAETLFEYSTEPIRLAGYNPPGQATVEQVADLTEMLHESEQPVLLVGHGVIMSRATKALIALIEKGNIPVSTTLLGIDAIPASHPLNLGMMGMHGNGRANRAIQEADLIIACGMRFDDRVTGKLNSYSPNSKKIHIDIDASELNKNVRVNLAVNADLSAVIDQVSPRLESRERKAWLGKIAAWTDDDHARDIIKVDAPELIAAQVIHTICAGTPDNALIVTDVGQHQMLEAQYYRHEQPHTLLTSGGLGTMGYSLPAAIGASFKAGEREIWVIAGDGSIQMNIQELATAVQEGANINIAIINNGYLGLVRQWQEMFYQARYVETPISSPDFVKLAEAYSLPGMLVEVKEDILPALEKARRIKGPVLIEFRVEQQHMVYPMVPAGASLDSMIRRPSDVEQKNETVEAGTAK